MTSVLDAVATPAVAPDAGIHARTRADRATTLLFGTTAFLASGLLFVVQPMAARLLLPRLGGSAAVWNTSMVFFQATLLAGYAIAHLTLRRLRPRPQKVVHLLLLSSAGVVLPLSVPAGWTPPYGEPIGWVLLLLGVVVGLPFLVLSAMSPTLQGWLAFTDHPARSDPYFLYGAGNAGSFLALLAYPMVIEPFAGVTSQLRWWTGAYVLLVVLTVACAGVAHRRRLVDNDGAAVVSARVPLERRRALRWIAIAAVPSALLLGVTRHVATDVASVPLLWTVPLALYLLSFVLAFNASRTRLARYAGVVGAALAVPALLQWVGFVLELSLGALVETVVALAAFAAIACAAHRRLWDDRPGVEHLTAFYLCVSVGGVAGGALAALVAPLVFDTVLEFPLALIAGVAILGRTAASDGGRHAVVARVAIGAAGALLFIAASGAVALLGLLALGAWASIVVRQSPKAAAVVLSGVLVLVVTFGHRDVLRQERTFYGVSLVLDRGDSHVLQSGTTVHGVQRVHPGSAREPLSYYSRSGPIGQVVSALRGRSQPLDLGVIGLGAGSMAAYGEWGDRVVFYEIDPAIVEIAQDPRLFTYVPEARAEVVIRTGDGRLVLDRGSDVHDLLVLDAFSSDAIPMHLLTREAFQTYRQHLTADGVLAVHVSSRYFELAPQVAALAEDAGLSVRKLAHTSPGDALISASEWVVATASPDVLAALDAGDWSVPDAADSVWTDDRSNLLATLRL